MWLRNNWQLWGMSRLSFYFNNIGVYHPDDMSGIILTSYQRHLKGEDIKLEEQIKHYQDYWNEGENGGDTVSYSYNYGFVSNEQKEKWIDDECIAKGIVLKKNLTKKSLKVKIIECCDKKGIIVYDNKEMYEFDKKLNKWVRVEERVIKKAKNGKVKWFLYDMWDPKEEY